MTYSSISFIYWVIATIFGEVEISPNSAPLIQNLNYTATCAPLPINLNTQPGNDGSFTPLFEGLDVFHYPISSLDSKAQKYFDQGMVLSYGFNHGEAARSFKEVIRLAPDSPMGYWGLAYVLGPNYNAPMFPDVLGAANEAIQNARMRIQHGTQKEKGLIQAISKRYPKNNETDPIPYYTSYADAMKQLMNDFPDDLDIAALTAEALMDLHPWDLWKEDGQPQPWTTEILMILDYITSKDSNHPQGNHLTIHALEASPHPENALQAAENLRYRVPGAGHLVHMPSHIYINTGHYHDGTLANERAVKIDSHYMERCVEAGVYPLALVPHNWHFLAACAALEGDGEKALFAARYMAQKTVDQRMLLEPDWVTLQHYYSIPWFVMVKFGMWDEILEESRPDSALIYPNGILSYARAMAFLHKGQMGQSLSEIKLIKKTLADTNIAENLIWDSNKMTDILLIAKEICEAYLDIETGHFSNAELHFYRATEVEDKLNYQEPPDWFFSVRHHYGQLLLERNKFAEAEKLYREDLENFPKNGYALNGLKTALVGGGKLAEAMVVEKEFNLAWQWSTVELAGSIVKTIE